MAAGVPFLGAMKTIRAFVDGDDVGLGTFLNHVESRMLSRSMGRYARQCRKPGSCCVAWLSASSS
jgi:hypothetical protein